MQTRFITYLVATVLLLLPSNSAHAQWFQNAALNAIQLDVQGAAIRTEVRNQSTQNGAGKTPSNSSKAPAKQIRSKLLTYRPSVDIRQANLKKIIEKTRQINPEGAVQMEQLFAATNVMGQIDKAMTTVGLKSNNVADAYAVYWTNAWLGARGRNEDLPKAQMLAVRNQAANALLASPQFKLATDAQKQEMTEAMLIQSALISASIDSAKSDPASMEKVKVAISQGAKGMGLDLDRMTLTPQGFRPIN